MNPTQPKSLSAAYLVRGESSVNFHPKANGSVLIVTKASFQHREVNLTVTLEQARNKYRQLVEAGFEVW